MRKSLLPIYFFVLLTAVGGFADTVTLTSGEKLEGKIIAETPDTITVSVKVSASITDERIIKRADIQKIETTPPDEIAYQQIRNLKPDPLTAQETEIGRAIGTLKSFLEKFPQSPHKADVQASLALFQKENEHLAAGEVKFYGTWITKEEAGKRGLAVEAQAFIPTMKGQIAQGDLIGALNTFDRLEKTSSSTRAYPIAIDLAQQILPVLVQQVDHSIEKLKYDTDAWLKGPDSQSPEIIAARKAEQEKYDAILADVQKNQIKWPPYLARSDKGLDTLRKLIVTENTRLASLPRNKMITALQCADKAREALNAHDTAVAESLLNEATALWPLNEDTAFLKKVLADRKTAEAKIAAAAAKATATPKPKPSGTPRQIVQAAPAASPTPAAGSSQNPALAFFLTVPGALTIVGGAIVLLAIVAVVQKAKKPKDGIAL